VQAKRYAEALPMLLLQGAVVGTKIDLCWTIDEQSPYDSHVITSRIDVVLPLLPRKRRRANRLWNAEFA